MTAELPNTQPSDDSVVSVLAEFADAGWSANHLIRSDGFIECGACGSTTAADKVAVGAMHRVEGASDPDDLQMVIGLSCPDCDETGAIVVAYGPSAAENDAAVLVLLELDGVVDPVAVNE